MFRLIKLLISLAALAGFVWFGANVPLGSRTLFSHLQAIGQTREAKDLLEGTKESARPLVEEAGRRLAHRNDHADKDAPPGGGSVDSTPPTDDERGTARTTPPAPAAPLKPPTDHVSDGDKQALRRVVGNAAARKPVHPVR